MDDVIALFHRYKDPVYRLALSFTGSPADAEDVTQTVFLKYLETQPELEEGKERAWLLQVTANQCRDLWRRLRRRGGETSLQGTKLLYHRPLIRHGFAVPPSPQGEGFWGERPSSAQREDLTEKIPPPGDNSRDKIVL